MNENNWLEIVIRERDGKGNETGRKLTKSFANANSAEHWYSSQRGHSVDRELNEMHNHIPVIKHKESQR